MFKQIGNNGHGTDISQNSYVTLDPIALDADSPTEKYAEVTDELLVVEAKNAEDNFQPVSRRRIIDIIYFFTQLQDKARHDDLFDCKAGNFIPISEKRLGLISVFKLECNICKEVCHIKSESTDDSANLNINVAATAGIVASGIGYPQFEELCSSMDIPVFSPKFYSHLQDIVYEKWEKTASESMQLAAEKEKELALAEGRTKNGICDVYLDASWCARSSVTNYKASLGTAAIIG